MDVKPFQKSEKSLQTSEKPFQMTKKLMLSKPDKKIPPKTLLTESF